MSKKESECPCGAAATAVPWKEWGITVNTYECEACGMKWMPGGSLARLDAAARVILEQKLAVAVEALEYYSYADHYEERVTLAGTRQAGVLVEGGGKAREALSKIRTIK